ncbi:unnamed protein product [Ectocarpus sp. 8 AP-2014]
MYCPRTCVASQLSVIDADKHIHPQTGTTKVSRWRCCCMKECGHVAEWQKKGFSVGAY